MEDFLNILNISVIWVLIGFAFFLLEFVIPGFILFFFGVGAWIVALLSFFFDIDLNIQIFLFIASSGLSVVFFRKWVRAKLGSYAEVPMVLEDEFIGKRAVAETSFGMGKHGKVTFKGTSWDAETEDEIAAGEDVVITATRSIVLIVKSTNK